MNCKGHCVWRRGFFYLYDGLVRLEREHGCSLCNSCMLLSCCFSLYILGQRLSLPGWALISFVYSGAELMLQKQYIYVSPLPRGGLCFRSFLRIELSTQASQLKHHCSCLHHTTNSMRQPRRCISLDLWVKEKMLGLWKQAFLGTWNGEQCVSFKHLDKFV